MSKTFFITLIILAITFVYLALKLFGKKTIDPKKLLKHNPITPQNTVITFDLHDVIVNYDYAAIIKTFFKSKKKLRLILALLNPLVWWDIIKLTYNKAIAEQYIVGLGEKHTSLQPYVQLGIKIANCQKINHNVIQIIKELKNRGYTLHMFSNIGTIICKQFEQKEPEIFQYFDDFILPSKQNGYLRKPHHNAFVNYLEKVKNAQKQVLFIDDKTRNTKKSHKYGIIGIQFKNHVQLREILKYLGVL